MKIAIIRLSALGDIIQASIILQFIKKHLPQAELTWLIDEKFSSLFAREQKIDRLIILPLKAKKFYQSYQIIKNEHFDIILDMQGLVKSALLARILGKNIVGFDRKSVKESLASFFYKKKIYCSYDENIIIRNLTLASQALNFSFTKEEILNKEACLSYEEKDFPFLSKTEKNILLAPFASEESKVYKHFDVLARELEGNILLCYSNEEEYEKAKKIAENSQAKLISLKLFDMISLMSKLNLLIGNDSGISHLAFAQNCASITLFGNRPSQRNAYQTQKNIVLDAGKKIDARKINKKDFCINEISPQLIIKKAKEILHD